MRSSFQTKSENRMSRKAIATLLSLFFLSAQYIQLATPARILETEMEEARSSFPPRLPNPRLPPPPRYSGPTRPIPPPPPRHGPIARTGRPCRPCLSPP